MIFRSLQQTKKTKILTTVSNSSTQQMDQMLALARKFKSLHSLLVKSSPLNLNKAQQPVIIFDRVFWAIKSTLILKFHQWPTQERCLTRKYCFVHLLKTTQINSSNNNTVVKMTKMLLPLNYSRLQQIITTPISLIHTQRLALILAKAPTTRNSSL